jgi:hypothetical protein
MVGKVGDVRKSATVAAAPTPVNGEILYAFA